MKVGTRIDLILLSSCLVSAVIAICFPDYFMWTAYISVILIITTPLTLSILLVIAWALSKLGTNRKDTSKP